MVLVLVLLPQLLNRFKWVAGTFLRNHRIVIIPCTLFTAVIAIFAAVVVFGIFP